MSEQLNRIEEMLGTLIKMVGDTNSRISKLEDEVRDFRTETAVNFKRIDRRIKSIESDLDETMVKVDEISLPKN